MTSSSRPLENRTALVTGASRGIGYATARILASYGAHVIATARTRGGLEQLQDEIEQEGGNITLAPLDLRDGEQLDSLGPALFKRFGKLDILIANAAILGPLSPVGHIREQDWNDVLETNLTANWRLVRTMDPLLKKAGGAKALFVTDGQGDGNAYWAPYAVSKAGMECLARCYAAETVTCDIQVIIVDPGPTETRLRNKAFPGEAPATVNPPEKAASFLVDKLLSSDKTSFQQYQHGIE